ncbi:MAG TPA: DUF4142 domain-containing protein [Luteimonas sp.]
MNKKLPLLYALLPLALVACSGDDGQSAEQNAATAGTSAGSMTDPGPASSAMGGTTGDATGAAGIDPTTGTSMATGDADRKALLAVEEVDRHEIAAAEDALSKNVEGEVRRYAEMLRDDHTRNLEATRRLMGEGSGTSGSDGMAHGAGDATGVAGSTGTSGTAGTTRAGGAMGPGANGMQGGTMGADGDQELAAMRQRHEAERTRLAALEGEEFERAWIDAMVRGHTEALAKLDNELIPGASDSGVSQHLRDTRAAIQRHLDTARSLQDGSGTGTDAGGTGQ